MHKPNSNGSQTLRTSLDAEHKGETPQSHSRRGRPAAPGGRLQIAPRPNHVFMRWALGLLGFAFLLSICTTGTLEFFIRTVVDHEELFDQSAALFFEYRSPNAVFGASVSASGFIQENADFVNLALEGESLRGQEMKIRRYYATMPPGKVVLGANPQTLGRTGELQTEHFAYEEFFAHSRRPMLRVFEKHHRSRVFYYLKHYIVEGRLPNRRRFLPQGGDVNIDLNADLRWANLLPSERQEWASVKAEREVPHQASRSINESVFLRILTFLKTKNADVCIVSYPMTAEFRSAASQYPQFAMVRRWFSLIASDNGFRYVNHWDAFDEPTLFADPTHLSRAGGRAHAPIVLRDCFGIGD